MVYSVNKSGVKTMFLRLISENSSGIFFDYPSLIELPGITMLGGGVRRTKRKPSPVGEGGFERSEKTDEESYFKTRRLIHR